MLVLAAAALSYVAPLAKSGNLPPVIVTGGTTANLVYGKLQRAAQLPGGRLDPIPIAAVENRGALSSMLWSSFAMSSVNTGAWTDRDSLLKTTVMAGSLLFVDATATEGGGGGFSLPNPFAKKAPTTAAGAAPVDAELLKYAAARGALHAYVLTEGTDAAVSAAVAACESAITELETSDGAALCATVIAPCSGATIASSKGWVQNTNDQSFEGTLSAALSVSGGYDQEGKRLVDVSGGGVLAREDFAEVTVQCALRLARDASEDAPSVRVLRVSPGAGTLEERPVATYDAILGGPKTRKRLGTVSSANWDEMLAPFGVVRTSNPNDFRELVDVNAAGVWIPQPKLKKKPKEEAVAPPEEEEAAPPEVEEEAPEA